MIKCTCLCGSKLKIDTGSISTDKELWAGWMLAHQPCVNVLVRAEEVSIKLTTLAYDESQEPENYYNICQDCGFDTTLPPAHAMDCQYNEENQ